jgi:hypothetical protein
VSEDQVHDAYGRLFARIMDKRDGVGSQAAVDEARAEVLANIEAKAKQQNGIA